MRALAPAVDGDVWGDSPGQQGFDERGGEEPLSAPRGVGRKPKRRFARCSRLRQPVVFRGRRAKDFRAEAKENSVAVLYERIHRVAGVGAGPDVSFETNRQSGSLTERCVALPRFSPRKSTARLPGSGGPSGHLYVMRDVFSRYVVGWMVAHRGSATLAERFLAETCARQGIGREQLAIHADRGQAMISKSLAFLLADLGVSKTHSRPHVSNDNPFSEAQFKTFKYRLAFLGRFGSIQDARAHGHVFFP